MDVSLALRLGRSVVIDRDGVVPAGWESCRRVRVDAPVLADPKRVADDLCRAWWAREPVVIELGVAAAELQLRPSFGFEPLDAGVGFAAHHDRLAFAVWANSYDARAVTVKERGRAEWWWAVKAQKISPAVAMGGPGDVVLPDLVEAVVDGGPRWDAAVRAVSADGFAVWPAEHVEIGSPGLELWGDTTAGLADDQLRAVTGDARPARVIAPAGSGKTRTLTARIAHLVADRGVDPGLVLAVAYNTKAAQELRDRLAVSGVAVRVATVHALAWSILREFSGRSWQLLDEVAVRDRLSGLCPVSFSVNTDPLAPYVEGLAAVRLQLRSPAEVETSLGLDGFRGVYRDYVAGLRADGAADFDAQIYEAIRLLLSDGVVRRRVQLRARHVLVDEFQDLTPAYLLLLRLVTAPPWQVFAVGDDDQVLYSHAGASPSFLIDFDDWFPQASMFALETNYRCPPAVVDAAGALLSRNVARIPKTIRAAKTGSASGLRVEFTTPGLGGNSGAAVAWVRHWLNEGVPGEKIAVLCRVNAALLAVHSLAAASGIAVDSPLDARMLRRTGLRAALGYLRCAVAGSAGPWEAPVVAELVNRPNRRVPAAVRAKIAAAGLVDVGGLKELGGSRHGDAMVRLAADLSALGGLYEQRAATSVLLRYVRDTVGLGDAMRGLDLAAGASSSHLDDIDGLIAAASAGGPLDAAEFEGWLRASLQRRAGAVRLSSVHRVKGLEFDRVVVLGVQRPLMPHRLSADVEDERRVLHVALTRAKQEVVLLAESGEDAPFLGELGAVTLSPHRLTSQQ